MTKIDVYAHILPADLARRLEEAAGARGRARVQTLSRVPAMTDVNARLALMEPFPDYRQILTLAGPPYDDVRDTEVARDLAAVANDAMAELVQRYPDRFVGFAAALPLTSPELAVAELERSVDGLGALGAQIHTNVLGRPLDDPRFEGIFETIWRRDKVLWVHGTRTAEWADYPTEPRSKYGLWLAFGWPYEISIFMARMVFSGMLERFPGIKVIAHHGGGMIPAFAQRARAGIQDSVGGPDRSVAEGHSRLTRTPLEYFRMFHADTTVSGVRRAIRAELDFFGTANVLFGTDMPFGPEDGLAFVRDTIRAIDELELTPADRTAVLETNAERLIGTGAWRRTAVP